MARITTLDSLLGGTLPPVSLRSTRERATRPAGAPRPVRGTRSAPCQLACPAGTDVRAALRLAADDDLEAAWRTVLEHNPLPGICGRTCDRPCERSCNRAAIDGAIAVADIERTLATHARRRGLGIARPAHSTAARHVAVIGAGPAGISCAYHLARRGHLPTVFEAMPEAGGRLRYGVPPFRLPGEVLDAELETVWNLGVGFQPNARFGISLAWEDLSAYAAVFVAIGANRAKTLALPGAGLAAVRSAWEFLRTTASDPAARIAGEVVVIGGGTMAIDAARTALRIGASRVTVACRRSRADVRAEPGEVAQAEAEGVEFVFDVAPRACEAHAGRLAAVVVRRIRTAATDGSGRPRLEPAQEPDVVLPAAHALVAIGGSVDLEGFGVVDADDDRIYADAWGRTTLPAIFAGGAAAQGPRGIADAIGSGRRAAAAIDAWLAGRDPIETPRAERVGPGDLNAFHVRHAPRSVPGRLDPERARRGMDEVVRDLDHADAVREARRCLSCGLCVGCDTCLTFCPEGAIAHEVATHSCRVDQAHCKGCGICATECPRGAIVLAPEEPA